MRTIEQSVDIDAPISKVWKILTTPRLIRRWASAFLPGICAESDWKAGGELLWRKQDGTLAQRGVIVAIEPACLLKVAFPPEINDEVPEPDTEFVETFSLTATDEGARLSVVCGPLHLVDLDSLDPKWAQALSTIKALAENGRPAGRRGRQAPAYSSTAP